jgi:tryptophan 2,3-dioxygenase
MGEAEGPLYYHDYLELDRLLSSQSLESGRRGEPAHDELLFVIVHQAYELWFKQILHELEAVQAIFAGVVDDRDMLRVVGYLARITQIERLMIDQVEVLETMTPLDFLDFRDLLVPASGFQSLQFRLIENRLGVPSPARPLIEGAGYTTRFTDEHRRLLEESERQPTLFEQVQSWLARTPFLSLEDFDFWRTYRSTVEARLDAERRLIADDDRLDEEERAARLKAFDRSVSQYEALFDPAAYDAQDSSDRPRLSHKAFEAALFINLYRDVPIVQLPFQVLTALMNLDEGLTNWRYRHALMVRRMIGARVGTGGTSGYHYLRQAAERSRVFTDLFAVSTFLLPRSEIPPLPAEVERAMGFYFAAGDPPR